MLAVRWKAVTELSGSSIFQADHGRLPVVKESIKSTYTQI